jgi:hypothetical protein
MRKVTESFNVDEDELKKKIEEIKDSNTVIHSESYFYMVQKKYRDGDTVLARSFYKNYKVALARILEHMISIINNGDEDTKKIYLETDDLLNIPKDKQIVIVVEYSLYKILPDWPISKSYWKSCESFKSFKSVYKKFLQIK